VYQSILHISWIDKLLENIRALFTELYKDQLSNSRTTKIDCDFDPYFDRQIQDLEKSGPITPAVTVSGRDAENQSNPIGTNLIDNSSDVDSRPVSRGALGVTSDTSRPASPATHLLTAKNGPGGRGSRRSRKAVTSSFPVSSGDESGTQKSKTAQKGKKMRKWGADGFEDAGDDDTLDFSEQQSTDVTASKMQAIDSASWGTRTADGHFHLKDIGEEMNDILSSANQKKTAGEQQPTGLVSSGLGALGGLFRNVVGGKVLTKADLDAPLRGMEDHLMKKNVAREAAVKLCDSIERDLVGVKTSNFTSMYNQQTNHLLLIIFRY
jgi:signal recognition particle receptor subunit alpha